MSDLRIIPLGVGDAFTALHYSTCLAVLHGDDCLLVDCPHPIQKMMREASLASGERIEPSRVTGLVLTHLHADHSSGVEGLAYWLHFYKQTKLKLVAHPNVVARLWDGHLAAGMEQLMPTLPPSRAIEPSYVHKSFDEFFDVVPLDEARAATIGSFSIECMRTIHHIPTYAVRIRAGGRALGHSADTAFDPELIAWLSEADLVVHETNYGTHTPYEKLAALPPQTRAKMRLIHYPDDFDLAASVIEPLHQGRVVRV
jgi:ribonuclease BN (tRNA processing enzyme)